ncbi:hypothetical protein [Donghicola mangrovi]|uniref:Uncharacterized protein n=1 Tax=Donghicola mangrovi TaxID=2729614 RepID=A0A850QAS3_9RHOB|nr:hypothetical protein [Donghicola mangrovi]NVO23031.1 hypothetical protein [Donghicola mangrovi]
MNLLFFREFYLKVLLSAWLVIVAMLAMQLSLNVLKFKSLVGQATASQMQVVGSTIEASVLRAEQVGLAIEEIVGLQPLIEREVEKDPTISRIIVVSPTGRPLVQSDAEGLPEGDRAAVLRRIFSVSEQESAIDRGDWIYSGRTLLDSSGIVMGAVILMARSDVAMASTATVRGNLLDNYGLIFGLVAAALIPLVVYMFRDVGAIYGLLQQAPLRGTVTGTHTGEAGMLARDLEAGNAEYAQAESDLSTMQEATR